MDDDKFWLVFSSEDDSFDVNKAFVGTADEDRGRGREVRKNCDKFSYRHGGLLKLQEGEAPQVGRNSPYAHIMGGFRIKR